jgi:predicted nucleic acid-binding protein
MADVTPVTSLYAIDEVRRNIKLAGHDIRFIELAARTQLVSDANVAFVPDRISLARKDLPILAAAIAASVDYLVTGDLGHFSHLYGSSVSNVKILNPGEFLRIHQDRLRT